MRETEHVWGQGNRWEISVTSPQFCCEATATLKKLKFNEKGYKKKANKPKSSLRKEIKISKNK